MTRRNGLHPDTILEHVGRDPAKNFGIVNPPVYHASTVIFPSLKTLLETRVDRARGAFEGITYGREGTPTTRAFESGNLGGPVHVHVRAHRQIGSRRSPSSKGDIAP
jgi:cystathionine beta-lyase/cystathionine gamma-synthase